MAEAENNAELEPEALEQVDEVETGENDETNTDDAQESEEVEVVLTGEPAPDTEQMPVKAFHARRKRYERQIGNLETESTAKDQTITELQEKLAKLTPPDVADSDYDDQKHAQATAKYEAERSALIAEQTTRQIIGSSQAEAQARQAKSQDEALLNSHYDRAEKLKVTDYVDAEDKATEIIGSGLVGEIMRMTDNSELVLYHLGKNPEKAAAWKQLAETDSVKATLQLGAMSAQLQAKPKSNKPPPPADEVEGATPASANHFQREYDKALEKLAKSDSDTDMSILKDIRKRAAAAGKPIR